jgi:hypothetical protein
VLREKKYFARVLSVVKLAEENNGNQFLFIFIYLYKNYFVCMCVFFCVNVITSEVLCSINVAEMMFGNIEVTYKSVVDRTI